MLPFQFIYNRSKAIHKRDSLLKEDRMNNDVMNFGVFHLYEYKICFEKKKNLLKDEKMNF